VLVTIHVDDIFVILKKSQVNETLNWLNSQLQKIQFTMEEEQSGQLPFLDVMVQRQYIQLNLDVYLKPTSTKRYITADSFHPQSQKNAVFHLDGWMDC
jgi:predicted sulfurtransferase